MSLLPAVVVLVLAVLFLVALLALGLRLCMQERARRLHREVRCAKLVNQLRWRNLRVNDCAYELELRSTRRRRSR